MFTSINSQQDEKSVLINTDFQPKEKFLYIGDTAFFHHSFKTYFTTTILATDLSEAKLILSKEVLPALIIIDIPLNHLEMVAFKVWLTGKALQNIPIIYNQSALSTTEIKQIFSQKIVDDVVTLEDHFRKLSYKTRFIQKIKNSHSAKAVKKINYNFISEPCRFCIGKKILDTIISAIIIIFCIPLFIIISVAIALESKGPVFYSSRRAGRGFRIFKFYKFRTMIIDADKQIKELESLNQYTNTGKLPAFFKLQDDPRVTTVGAFLRKTSLDELPQLFNVIKGDMSIVGNRPLPLYEASTLTTDEWSERFMAPAGITGLWQVSKRGKENMSNEERVLLDIHYARTRTLLGDVIIMLQTPAALIQKTNV